MSLIAKFNALSIAKKCLVGIGSVVVVGGVAGGISAGVILSQRLITEDQEEALSAAIMNKLRGWTSVGAKDGTEDGPYVYHNSWKVSYWYLWPDESDPDKLIKHEVQTICKKINDDKFEFTITKIVDDSTVTETDYCNLEKYNELWVQINKGIWPL